MPALKCRANLQLVVPAIAPSGELEARWQAGVSSFGLLVAVALDDIIQDALDLGMVMGQAEVAFHNSRIGLQPHINVEGLRLPVAAGDLDVVNTEVAVDNVLTVDDVLAVRLAAQVIVLSLG